MLKDILALAAIISFAFAADIWALIAVVLIH